MIVLSESELGQAGCGGFIEGQSLLGLEWHGRCCDTVLLLPVRVFILGFNRDS